MKIAEDMKSMTRNIMAAYDQRMKSVGGIVDGTRTTLKGFARDRRKLNDEQSKALADFTGELSSTIESLLKGIRDDLKTMAHERTALTKELKAKLAKEAREIKGYTDKKLKDYMNARGEMSATMKKELTQYLKDIGNSVKGILGGADALIGDYRADMKKAAGAWSSMAATLANARKKGLIPAIEVGEDVATVEDAVDKKSKKKKEKEENA